MDKKIRVLVIDYRPVGVDRYHNAEALAVEYSSNMLEASSGIADYHISQILNAPYFPVFEDGSSYTAETYNLMRAGKTKPITINGQLAMADYKDIAEIKQLYKNINEVWTFGLGWFGAYESRYIGLMNYWVNSPAFRRCCKSYIVMGFNRERDYTQMLHSFAHRAENIISRKLKSTKALRWCYAGNDPGKLPDPKNDWEWYLKTVGTVHKVPGGAEYSQEPTLYQWLAGLNPEWWRMAVKC